MILCDMKLLCNCLVTNNITPSIFLIVHHIVELANSRKYVYTKIKTIMY